VGFVRVMLTSLSLLKMHKGSAGRAGDSLTNPNYAESSVLVPEGSLTWEVALTPGYDLSLPARGLWLPETIMSIGGWGMIWVCDIPGPTEHPLALGAAF